jgi:hypothetical protein
LVIRFWTKKRIWNRCFEPRFGTYNNIKRTRVEKRMKYRELIEKRSRVEKGEPT